jgi:hypothetical protein
MSLPPRPRADEAAGGTAGLATVPPGEPPRGLTRQDIFSVLGALGAIITLVTAIMFYFGWRRSDVQARVMGIDVSLFGYSSQDYVLRSLSSLYLPLIVLSGMALGWLRLHQRVVRVVSSPGGMSERRRLAARSWTSGVAVGAAAVAASGVLFTLLAGLTSPPIGVRWLATRLQGSQWVVPLVIVVATLTAAYVGWIHRRLQPVQDTWPRLPLWQTLLPAVLVGGTVVLSTFWLLEEYASAVGRGYAQQLANTVDRLSRTVVISPRPLGIVAPGVHEERLGAPDSPAVLYRTTGLRLLARSGGKVLLVHDGWNPSTGTVIVLPDSDDLRWEFSH